MKISKEKLRNLCIRRNWFYGGTNSQYEKLFQLVEENATLEELALVIWLCSNDCSREEVLAELESIATPARMCCTCRYWRTANLEGDMYCEDVESERYMEWTDSDEKCENWAVIAS